MTTRTHNLPPQYRQTELGVIPVDWELGSLGDSATKIGSGKTPTGGSKVYRKDGRPLLRSQNIGWGTLFLDDVAYIDDLLHATFPSTEIMDRDVLLNITGASIGRCAVADKRVVGGNVNQHVCIIRTHRDKLNPRFLGYFLLSEKGQKQIDSLQAGGNRQGLNFGQIESFKIAIPPTEKEQASIATAISDSDSLIVQLESLIEKKKNIKQGAMQELLTGKKRLPGFSGKWETRLLEEIADVNMGQSPSSSSYNITGYGIPLIQGNADIKNRKSLKRVWTTQKTKTCRAGDLIMTVRAPVGLVGLATDDSCLGRGVCSFKIKGIQKDFLFHSLIFNESAWKLLEQGSTFTAANSSQINRFELGIPPTQPEQTAIATILSDMDAEIAGLESQLTKYRGIKQGMMQSLLTGQIRLT